MTTGEQGVDPQRSTPRSSSTIAGGAGVLILRRYLLAALGWAGTVVIVRQLSPSDWGRYSFIFALLGLLGFISDLRIGRIVIRMVADDSEESDRAAGSYLVLRLLIGAVTYGLALAIVFIGDYPTAVRQGVAVAGLAVIVGSCDSALYLVFSARMWFRTITISTAVGAVIQLALVLAIAGSIGGTVVWFTLPALAAAIVELVWKLWAVRHHLRLTIDRSAWWGWCKEAAPLALGGTLSEAYFRIDSIMLERLDGFEAVGVYSIGYKFADLAGSLPGTVLTPALTLMIHVAGIDVRRFSAVFRQTFLLLLVLAVGVCVGFSLYAEEAISLLYGERYRVASGAATGLILGVGLRFFTQLSFTTLVAVGRNRIYPVAAGAGLALNVGLNLVLIPMWSYDGAAMATIATEVVVVAILGWAASRAPGVRPLPWRPAGRVMVAGGAMALAAVATATVAPWFVAGLVGGLIYLAVLHVLAPAGEGGLRAFLQPPS